MSNRDLAAERPGFDDQTGEVCVLVVHGVARNLERQVPVSEQIIEGDSYRLETKFVTTVVVRHEPTLVEEAELDSLGGLGHVEAAISAAVRNPHLERPPVNETYVLDAQSLDDRRDSEPVDRRFRFGSRSGTGAR